MDILLMLAGFAGLVLGGDLLVRGAISLAQAYGISPMVIGLTLVGFGTSTPELLTSVQAALAGSPGIAVGNVVGSNTANILLILGLSALIIPIAVSRAGFQRDGSVLALATVICLALVLTGSIGRMAGVALMAGLLAYLVGTLYLDRGTASAAADTATLPDTGPLRRPIWRYIGQFALGLALTMLAARFLVTGAINLAEALGVSEAVIGVTIVAIGTSLPELVTSVVAARKGQADIALGNILGSNIFNILGILGATVLVRPLTVPVEILDLDIWVMVGATVFLIGSVLTGWRISRGEGFVMMLAYAAYVVWLAVGAV